VQVRMITPLDLRFPEGYFEQESVKEYASVEKQAKREGRLEERWIKRVDTPIGVSDKLSGRVFFPTTEGHFDYKGFTVTDERFHKYCKDLFEYYWNKATTKIPDQILEALAK